MRIGSEGIGVIAAVRTSLKALVDESPDKSALNSDTASRVALSSTGRELAARDERGIPRTASQEALLRAMSTNSPEALNQQAYEMAYYPSRVMFNISQGDVRLASTGQLVEDGYVETFERLAAGIDRQQRELYETEKARGTPPLEIIERIIDFRNAQSSEYHRATAWGYF